MTMTDISSAGTRERLLAAAAEAFAEHGYRAATVRDICRRARANVAAVNYHFRDKAGLYEEVIRGVCAESLAKYPLRIDALPLDAEARLALFVRTFLSRIFDPGFRSWSGKLMSREMIEPTPALDRMVADAIRPQFDLLQQVVRDLLGPQADAERVRWGAFSVVSQCVFWHHSRAVIERLFPEQMFGPEEIERLAAHIAQVCISGLRGAAAPPRAARR